MSANKTLRFSVQHKVMLTVLFILKKRIIIYCESLLLSVLSDLELYKLAYFKLLRALINDFYLG